MQMRRARVALALSTALAGGLFVSLLLTTHASPRALPWFVVLPVVGGLYALANRTQYLRPTASGTTLLYSPTAPFLLAGAILLPPAALAVLALVTTPPHGRHQWNNLTLRLGTMSAAALGYWAVLGARPQEISGSNATTQAVALLAAMAAFEAAQLGILNGSIWVTDGISLARQAATWGTEYLSGEVWELSAGAAAATLALTAPVLLVPAAGLLVLIVRQTQYAQAIHDRDRDAKTGLLNMRAFTRLADRELSSARRHGYPLAFLMLDVDHLRAINTAHGHVGGDAAIHTVAACSPSTCATRTWPRASGARSSRSRSRTPTWRRPPRRRNASAGPSRRPPPGSAQHTLSVTVSIGVSRFCPNDSLDDLLVSADRALYEAKDDGRNLVRLAVRARVGES